MDSVGFTHSRGLDNIQAWNVCIPVSFVYVSCPYIADFFVTENQNNDSITSVYTAPKHKD